MSDRKIKVTIDALGNPKIEPLGYNGDGCVEATAALEAKLGGVGAKDRELKSEYYEAEDGDKNTEVGW